MKRNGHDLWRWVWCWLSVLIAGCAARSGGGTLTAASALPLATMPRPILTLPTLTPIWRVIRPSQNPGATTTASQNTTAPGAEPPGNDHGGRVVTSSAPLISLPTLTLEPLACYRSAPAGLWCLGAIRNELDVPYAGISLRITLLNAANVPLFAKVVSAARPVVRPGEEAPYGVLFPNVPDTPNAIGGATVELMSALPIVLTPTTNPILVNTIDVRLLPANQVSGTIQNRSTIQLSLNIVVTLFDSDDRVLGYRQVEDATSLRAGDTRSITVNMQPLTKDRGITRVAMAVDGFSSAN